MCFETACLVISKGSASSLTVAGPRLSRAIDPPTHRVGQGGEGPVHAVVVGHCHSILTLIN